MIFNVNEQQDQEHSSQDLPQTKNESLKPSSLKPSSLAVKPLPKKWTIQDFTHWIAVLFLIVFAILMQLPQIQNPQLSTQSLHELSYFAKLLKQGLSPWQSLALIENPVIYYLQWPLQIVSLGDLKSQAIVLSVFMALGVVGIYATLRILSQGKTLVSFIAGLFAIVYLSNYHLMYPSQHSWSFAIASWTLFSFLYALRTDQKKLLAIALSGGMFGIYALSQVMGIWWFLISFSILASYNLFYDDPEKKLTIKQNLSYLGLFLGTFLVAISPFLVFAELNGLLLEELEVLCLGDLENQFSAFSWPQLVDSFFTYHQETQLLLILIALGWWVLHISETSWRIHGVVLGLSWLFFSWIGFFDIQHGAKNIAFLSVIPMSILALQAWSFFDRIIYIDWKHKWHVKLLNLAIFLLILTPFITKESNLFQTRLSNVMHLLDAKPTKDMTLGVDGHLNASKQSDLDSENDAQLQSIAQYIKKQNHPEERIWTLKQLYPIYAYSDRLSASIYPFQADASFGKMWKKIIKELKTEKPAYILLPNEASA
jgi:hypothetical protein